MQKPTGLLFVSSLVFSITNGPSSADTQSLSRFAPDLFGLPKNVAGYTILAVASPTNFPCLKTDEYRIYIQSQQPSIEDGGLQEYPHELILQELETAGIPRSSDTTVVGPGVTRAEIFSQLENSAAYHTKTGCLEEDNAVVSSNTLALPGACASLGGGEYRCSAPGPGFAIIQNRISSTDANNGGHSVMMIAPRFGNGQIRWQCSPASITMCGGYSALLLNGMTDKGYFLQVGLYFTSRPTEYYPLVRGNNPISDCVGLPVPPTGNPFSPDGRGWVVWAAAQTKDGKTVTAPKARALCVPYVAGHHYYAVISYSGGTWWTCAADAQNQSTYRCKQQGSATGTKLVNNRAGTNVFFENWNKEATWNSGFPYQMVAYGATLYVGGKPRPWSAESKYTVHSCKDKRWPPSSAIVNSSGLTNNRYAYLNTSYLPLYCQ